MRAIDIFLLVAFILIALLVIYYIYKQVIWSKINKYYAFAKFNDALNEINKLYKFSTPIIRKKMIVYKTSCLLLLDKRNEIDEQINEVRSKIQEQMESHGLEKTQSKHFTVSYTPSKIVMQFDSRAFRAENEELYASYCKAKQWEASIVVKRNSKR